MFYHSYILFLPFKVGNYCIMSAEIRAMPWLPNTQDLQLLKLCWCSFSECSREHVTDVFGNKVCEYLINGCLQPIGTKITQDAKVQLTYALLGLILRIGRWPSCCLCCQNKRPKKVANMSVMHNHIQITVQSPYLQDYTSLTQHRRSIWGIVHSTSAAINNCFHHDLNLLIVFLADWESALWQSWAQ